jgi:WD40 repeat protein
MVFARDSPRMFSGSANGFVYLWDANSRQMLANWAAYPDYVSIPEIALTPDETRLLTAGSDGKAILWDLGKYYPIWQFSKYGDSVRSVDIDPDPDPDEKTNNLILGYASGEIILVNLETGEPICTLNGHTNSVNSVRFSPDGKTAISGSNDYTVIKWDVSTCTKVTTLFRHDSWVMALAFSPDGRLVGSASADGTTILWDLEADRQVYRLRLPEIGINPGLDALGLSLDFSPDGRLLATGSANGSVAIWSVENGILLRKWIAYPAESCEYGVHCFWVLSTKFSRSGYEVWTSSADGMVRVWSLIQASDISELREWLVQNRHAHELTAQEKDAYDIGE